MNNIYGKCVLAIEVDGRLTKINSPIFNIPISDILNKKIVCSFDKNTNEYVVVSSEA